MVQQGELKAKLDLTIVTFIDFYSFSIFSLVSNLVLVAFEGFFMVRFSCVFLFCVFAEQE